MTRKDIAAKVSAATHITKRDAAEFTDAVFAAVAEGLANHEKVAVTGFGVFDVVERAEREGHNPKTGETVYIPAHFAVRFRPAEALKTAAA